MKKLTLNEYIQKVFTVILPKLSYKDYKDIEFEVTLNEKAELDDKGLNKIKFTYTYK